MHADAVHAPRPWRGARFIRLMYKKHRPSKRTSRVCADDQAPPSQNIAVDAPKVLQNSMKVFTFTTILVLGGGACAAAGAVVTARVASCCGSPASPPGVCGLLRGSGGEKIGTPASGAWGCAQHFPSFDMSSRCDRCTAPRWRRRRRFRSFCRNSAQRATPMIAASAYFRGSQILSLMPPYFRVQQGWGH